MAMHVKLNEKYKYTLPIIKISENEKIPVLPLYLIASLKNDKYIQSDLTYKDTKTEGEINYSNYKKYFSMSGVYQTFGSLNFSGELEISEVIKSPEEYATDVLSQYICDNYELMQKLLKITSFSKYLFISILFLLNEHKLSLKDIDDFLNLQSDIIYDIILDKLFEYKDLDYHNYVQPIDIQTGTADVKISDINVCNLSLQYSYDNDFISPIKLKTILEYSGIPSRKYIDGIINQLPPLPENFFIDGQNNYNNGGTLDFDKYIGRLFGLFPFMSNYLIEKYKYELDSALFRSKFPLIRKIENSKNDIFLNNGNIVPTQDTCFYQKSKYPNPYNKNIEYCDFIYYLETPVESFNNSPKIKIINLANYDFLVETSEYHNGTNTKIKMSEFVKEYKMEEVSTLAAIIRYKDLELLYLLDTRELAKMVKTTWGNISNEMLLNKINKSLTTHFNKPFINSFYTIINDPNKEVMSEINIINSKKDENEDGKIFTFDQEDTKYYILSPNDSYLGTINKKAVVFPNIKLVITLNNNNIQEEACKIIGNKIDNIYISNTAVDKTIFSKIENFEFKTNFDDVLYQIDHFNTQFNMAFNITTKDDEYSKSILRHTYIDIPELGKYDIFLGDSNLENLEIADNINYEIIYDDFVEETNDLNGSIPTNASSILNSQNLHIPNEKVSSNELINNYTQNVQEFDSTAQVKKYNSRNTNAEDLPYNLITNSIKELTVSFDDVKEKCALKETSLYYYNKSFYLNLENHNPVKTTEENGGTKV